ncbi:hypothetical protein BH20CHL7_BH20CHL7_02190 [soil metagenome]
MTPGPATGFLLKDAEADDLAKLGLASRTQAALLAAQRGLSGPGGPGRR